MLRRLLRRWKREGGDADKELRFWIEQWDAHIRGGALFSRRSSGSCRRAACSS
jgi:hypothetical protein